MSVNAEVVLKDLISWLSGEAQAQAMGYSEVGPLEVLARIKQIRHEHTVNASEVEPTPVPAGAKTWAEQHPAEALAEFLNMQHGSKYLFEVDPGGLKYKRVTQISRNADGSVQKTGKSVHCFVNAEGHIFKAAGYKAPYLKGQNPVRGTVYEVLSGAQKTDPYGGWLYEK